MTYGRLIEYEAQQQEAFRRQVIYPAVSWAAEHAPALRARRAAERARRGTARRLGALLIRLGERLVATAATPSPQS